MPMSDAAARIRTLLQERIAVIDGAMAVSYTHLTLPTILRV